MENRFSLLLLDILSNNRFTEVRTPEIKELVREIYDDTGKIIKSAKAVMWRDEFNDFDTYKYFPPQTFILSL